MRRWSSERVGIAHSELGRDGMGEDSAKLRRCQLLKTGE